MDSLFRKSFFIWLVIFLVSLASNAQEYVLRSPNEKAEVRIRVADKVYYSIDLSGTPVVLESPVSISIKEAPAIGNDPKAIDKKERNVDRVVTPVVPLKRSLIRDNFNELTITFTGGYGLVWRAYDNGVAYRWTIDQPGRITIEKEQVGIALNAQDTIYYPQEDSFLSHNERLYLRYKPSEIPDKFASLPALAGKENGVKLWISEADLYDYAGMWIEGWDKKGLRAVFPYYATKEEQVRDRTVKVTDRANYIAQTDGKRQFPWRVFGLAERDKDLINNEIVYLLSEDTKQDYSWVKPGKVPWDWWNANNIYGVDFKSGINTATYKYYIDFAAKYGLEYLILDEGWSKPDDLFAINPDIDMTELLAYAKKKKVDVVLWVVWLTLEKQFDRAFEQFEKWGVKGLKVDFMQRDDQKIVNYYERVAKETAKRKMLVDFHGAYKPTGMERKYPNVITREGVMGLEHNKWSKDETPGHNLDLPFIRMVAGPMDFTPGAMINNQQKDFQPIFNRPMSQGTRCHQLAMYVIYESPLQMLADSPSNYMGEPDAMEFLSKVPAVWKETVAVDGKVGEYLVLARQAQNGDWYIGAMTSWTPREINIDLSFLGAGNYQASIWQDGANAGRMGSDFQKITKPVKKSDKLTLKLAPGGGFAARLVKKASR